MLGLLIALTLFTVPLRSDTADPQKKPEVGIEEQLGAIVPLDLEFYDENGFLVKLRDVIDKPTILALVFYECKGICIPLLVETADVVNRMSLEPGNDYQILTVSFDPKEKPSLAQAKRFNFLKLVEKEAPKNFWKFMTGDSANIYKLTDAVGFYFMPEEDQFIHPGALIFLSPEGKVTRYLLGTKFLPFNVKMALIEASEGKIRPTIATLLKFCYSYDPEGRTYAMNLTRIVGVGMLVLIALFVVFVIIKPKRAKK